VTTSAGDGRAERVQAALYRIAELASSTRDMQEFYREVHAVVGGLMHANNFFIALYDDERQLINFPYYVDELDPDIPDPSRWDAFGEGEAKGATAYVLRTGEAHILTYERMRDLIARGEIELRGAATEDGTWLGVPLKADGRVPGVVAVQSYTSEVRYTEEARSS
jgi:transcriptional regulator with GAF, ATPase, and Fis domain